MGKDDKEVESRADAVLNGGDVITDLNKALEILYKMRPHTGGLGVPIHLIKMSAKTLSKPVKEIDKSKPLPCPFCGGKVDIYKWIMSTYWSLECRTAGCFISFQNRFESKEIALELWNKRAI